MSDPVEISADELSELRQAHALLKSMYGDSKLGMNFRKLVKEKFPNASIPELDILEQAAKNTSGVEKKVDDLIARLDKRDEDSKVSAFEERFEKIVKDRGYTKEGRDGLLKTMKDKNIHNPEDAAILFEAGQPKEPAKPRNFSSRMNFIESQGKEDEKYKQLMDDPEQFMADELQAAINEKSE